MLSLRRRRLRCLRIQWSVMKKGLRQKISDLWQLSCDDVRSLVQKSTRKTWNLDPIPTSMVVACLDELLPVVTCILNSSLALSHFPSKWKDALVDPRLKAGKGTAFPNLCPVSNLQYISELTKRAVYDWTHSHRLQHELYPLVQSAYRTGHRSCRQPYSIQNCFIGERELNLDYSGYHKKLIQ